jgi:hypothetical protein
LHGEHFSNSARALAGAFSTSACQPGMSYLAERTTTLPAEVLASDYRKREPEVLLPNRPAEMLTSRPAKPGGVLNC